MSTLHISSIWRYIKSLFKKGRFTSPSKPRVSFEITNICNANCVFCANAVMKRKKQPMDFKLFKKAVDELAAFGGAHLDFNVTIGDPLLDKSLLEKARYIKQYTQFKSLGFVTTLQWLHLHNIDEFFNVGFTWLSVSIVLSGRERYKEFFRVDMYDQTMSNLLNLIGQNQLRGNPICLLFSIKPTNEPPENILNHPDFKKINALVHEDLSEQVKSRSYFVDDWIGAVKLPKYLKKRPLYPRMFRPCGMLYGGLIVFSNGNVGACSCRDFEANSELILGNIEVHTLADMWNGEKLKSIRSDWLKKNKIPKICRSCSHYLY